MLLASWVTALAALATAITNGVAWIRHGREDDRRFADLHARMPPRDETPDGRQA